MKKALLWLIMVIAMVSLVGQAGAEENLNFPPNKEQLNKWTTTDTSLQVVYTTLHIMDWAQTLHIARNPNKYYEANVAAYIGEHPSTGKVNGFMATTLAINTAIPILIPKKWGLFGVPMRNLFQLTIIADRAKWVNHNRQIGLGITAHF